MFWYGVLAGLLGGYVAVALLVGTIIPLCMKVRPRHPLVAFLWPLAWIMQMAVMARTWRKNKDAPQTVYLDPATGSDTNEGVPEGLMPLHLVHEYPLPLEMQKSCNEIQELVEQQAKELYTGDLNEEQKQLLRHTLLPNLSPLQLQRLCLHFGMQNYYENPAEALYQRAADCGALKVLNFEVSMMLNFKPLGKARNG